MDLEVRIRDVTDDPAVAARGEHAPGLHRALSELGFSRVGTVETRLSNAREKLAHLVAGEDGERILEASEDGEVNTVWQAPTDAPPAFAVAERHIEAPVLVFCTVTADGQVLETAMKPARRPDTGGFLGLGHRDVSSPFRFAGRLAGWLEGGPGLWPRPHRPRAGLLLIRALRSLLLPRLSGPVRPPARELIEIVRREYNIEN